MINICGQKKEIQIDNGKSIILEEKFSDHEFVDVTYKSDNEEAAIGSYNVYNYDNSEEWLLYNQEYIAIMSKYYGYRNSSVKQLFDINNESFVNENSKQLKKIYQKKIKNNSEYIREI